MTRTAQKNAIVLSLAFKTKKPSHIAQCRVQKYQTSTTIKGAQNFNPFLPRLLIIFTGISWYNRFFPSPLLLCSCVIDYSRISLGKTRDDVLTTRRYSLLIQRPLFEPPTYHCHRLSFPPDQPSWVLSLPDQRTKFGFAPHSPRAHRIAYM